MLEAHSCTLIALARGRSCLGMDPLPLQPPKVAACFSLARAAVGGRRQARCLAEASCLASQVKAARLRPLWVHPGKNSKEGPKNAILGLRSTLEMLTKREKHLQNQMDEQDNVARKNVNANKGSK